MPLADTVACFESLRDEGLIGAWGLSNHDRAGIREALATATPALVQNSFSLLDRGDEARRAAALRASAGSPYVPFGPLAGGWLPASTGAARRSPKARG